VYNNCPQVSDDNYQNDSENDNYMK